MDANDLILVSVDDHAIEPPHMWDGRVPSKYADVVPKIRRTREEVDRRGLGVAIEVDGGIDTRTAPAAAKAGATIFVAGSAIFHAPDPAAAAPLSARNVGSVCPVPLLSSIETTEPIWGAILARLDAGFRPIWTHVWPSPCTAAQAFAERTSATESSWSAIFGISPCGNLRSPYDVGAMKAGVHAPSLRSNVSEWLGPPVIRMKMTFLAVPMVLGAAFATVSMGRVGSRK